MAHETKTPVDATWTRTYGKTIRLSHEWTIENFQSIYYSKPSGEWCIQSSKFSPKANDQVKFFLCVYPNRPSYECRLTVDLHCEMGKMSEVTTLYNFYIVDINNTKKHLRGLAHTFMKNSSFTSSLAVDKNTLMDKANGLLPDNKLTIFCEIIILEGIIKTSGGRELVQVESSKSEINNDFEKLFETLNLSDVTLTVSGKDIKAHKAVLAARSPVFLAMFMHNMEELKTNCVTINDIDYEVFMEALRFIYTDKAPNIEKMAIELLTVADKYTLEKLKSMCTAVLSKSLKFENAIDILVLSYLHNTDQLKDLAINFICNQTKDITETASFKSMADSYPGLMIELFRAISTKANGSECVTAEKEC